jgi:hypothetical protein
MEFPGTNFQAVFFAVRDPNFRAGVIPLLVHVGFKSHRQNRQRVAAVYTTRPYDRQLLFVHNFIRQTVARV